jgi:hypothetical protein
VSARDTLLERIRPQYLFFILADLAETEEKERTHILRSEDEFGLTDSKVVAILRRCRLFKALNALSTRESPIDFQLVDGDLLLPGSRASLRTLLRSEALPQCLPVFRCARCPAVWSCDGDIRASHASSIGW